MLVTKQVISTFIDLTVVSDIWIDIHDNELVLMTRSEFLIPLGPRVVHAI